MAGHGGEAWNMPNGLGYNGSFQSAADFHHQQQQQLMQHAAPSNAAWTQTPDIARLTASFGQILQQQQSSQQQFLAELSNHLAQIAQSNARDVRPRRDEHVPVLDGHPDQLLKCFDIQIQQILRKLSRDWERRVSKLFSQKTLEKKYAELDHSHTMHRDFKMEAEKPWQFANDYAAVATPSDLELRNMDSDAMSDAQYDVNKAWQHMRQRHSQECWQFVQQHQKRYLQHLERTTSREHLHKEASDCVSSFMLSLPAFYTEADRARIVGKIQAWTDLFSRHTLGAHSSRHRAQEEKALNRQKQLDDAQARYEAMDPRTFQVALALEAQNVKRKQDHKGRNTKPGPKVTVHQQSALGSVLSQNPALADEYNLQVKKNRGAQGSLGQPERRSTSRRSVSNRSRSTSFMSARSSTSRQSSRKSSRSVRFSRTPSQSSRKSHGRPLRTPRSTDRSQHSRKSRQDSKPKNGKGQPRGRSRGKTGSKAKGKGKARGGSRGRQ